MKRVPIVAILMFMLAACGLPSGVTSNGGSSNGGSSSGGNSNGGSSSGGDSIVSGQIVTRDSGEPYPNAYVRFAWLVNANYENEIHTVTDATGRYSIELPAGQYQVTAGDSCDLNAGFAIVGRAPDDVMITVPGTGEVDFVEYPITPGADLPGSC
ncbi:MAG TPA: carboxypeptidase-like regulatory domain-containing protein [Microlunatus sp.]|nr:carboxypeptidase-like regulatory domain-containing protein [Microlunatus sp.]